MPQMTERPDFLLSRAIFRHLTGRSDNGAGSV
jgi:hypothetical protein